MLLHVAGIWALLQVRAVRDAAEQVAPIFVSWLAAPVPQRAPAPPPILRPEPPQKKLRSPVPPAQVIAAAAPAAPEAFVVPSESPAEPVSVPVAAPPPSAPVAVAAPVPAAPPPAPRTLPNSAVQFLQPPEVVYPRVSQRKAETGLVVVRAYVGATGDHAQSVQVERSSGHDRLDQAALAAVRKARFKPYSENGQPVEGWALVPIKFELEK